MYFGCFVWLLKQLFGEGLHFLKKENSSTFHKKGILLIVLYFSKDYLQDLFGMKLQ